MVRTVICITALLLLFWSLCTGSFAAEKPYEITGSLLAKYDMFMILQTEAGNNISLHLPRDAKVENISSYHYIKSFEEVTIKGVQVVKGMYIPSFISVPEEIVVDEAITVAVGDLFELMFSGASFQLIDTRRYRLS